MPFESPLQLQRAAAHSARANVILYGLAAFVFGVAGSAAAVFDRPVRAGSFWVVAGALVMLAIVAAARARRHHSPFASSPLETRRKEDAAV